MAERLATNLWRLDIPLEGNPLKNLNSYLITGGERSLLIDTGFRQDSCRRALTDQLAETGVDRETLDIFLTHLHSDHTGLAPDFVGAGGRIYISETDGAGLRLGLTDGYWRDMYEEYVREGFPREEIDRLWLANPAQGAAPRNWSAGCVTLRDGDRLSYGGVTLRCILTPGHTPGHMCLYGEEPRWLFSGDHVLFHITPNICRWQSMPDALGSYLESLEKLRGLPAERLLPGHRKETGDLDTRIGQLEEHHRHRLNEVLNIVGSAPGRTAYEIAGRMRWSIRSTWREFPVQQKFFALGECLAHLDYLERRGRICRRERDGLIRYSLLP